MAERAFFSSLLEALGRLVRLSEVFRALDATVPMPRIEVRPEATDQFGFDPAAAHAARLQAGVGESCLELLALLPLQLCLPLGERETDGRDALAVQLGTSDQPQDLLEGRLGVSVRGNGSRILGSGVGRGGADQRVTQEGAQFWGLVRRRVDHDKSQQPERGRTVPGRDGGASLEQQVVMVHGGTLGSMTGDLLCRAP